MNVEASMFDLAIAKNELLPRLILVAGAVDKRQSLPILSHILCDLSEGKLTLTATDLEIEISASIPCENDINARITVPAKKFIDIIRSLDEGVVVHLKLTGNLLEIKAHRSQFKLTTLPADNFPANTQEQAEIELTLSRLDFIFLLQSTFFAMAQQDVRFYLNSLLLEFDGQMLNAVATDGHRMAVCRQSCATSGGQQRYLLPRKSAQEVLRLLNTVSDETISISVGKNFFRLLTQEYQFTSKLIEARFPPYNKAIPQYNDKLVLVDKESLKKTLSRISILAHEKSKAVLMHIQAQEITLIAHNQEQEEAMEVIEAHVEGEELKIGMNAGYLLDVLQVLPDEKVRLSMSTVDKSILVESLQYEHYLYIMMPLKL